MSSGVVRAVSPRSLTAFVKRSLPTPQEVHRFGGGVMRTSAHLAWLWKRRRGDFSLRVVDALVHRGDIVVDIGASWGLYTARLAALVGPSGRVHVFEPHPINQGNLRALRGKHTNLAVHPLALSDRAGTATLHVPVYGARRISALGTLTPPQASSPVAYEHLSVPLAKLDTTIAPESAGIGFVKIDVEGHELAVLRGAEGHLRHSRPALLIEIEQRHPAADFGTTVALLRGLGYDGYALHHDGLRPIEEFDVERDQLAFLGADFLPYGVEHGYIYDFLFVGAGTDVTRLLAPR